MKRVELNQLTCSLAGALAEVGDAWSLLILKEIMLGNRRFDGIAAQSGMSVNSLTERLKRLSKAGVLEKRLYQDTPPRFEYRLTTKGEELWPVLAALTQWGDKWQGRKTRPITYECRTCHGDAKPQLACDCCGTRLAARKVTARQSGAMEKERLVRAQR